MANPIRYLVESICEYFLQEPPNKDVTSLLRFHNEKLNQLGDISFPSDANIWRNYFKGVTSLRDAATDMLQLAEEAGDNGARAEELKNKFLAVAADWLYPVSGLQQQNGRYKLFLDRHTVMTRCFRTALSDSENYAQAKKCAEKRIYLKKCVFDAETSQSLFLHRAGLVANALERLLHYSKWNLVPETEANDEGVLHLQVSSVAEKGAKTGKADSSNEPIIIKCGIVCDPVTGKLAKLSTQEYHDLRANDMRLMALHKYGIRAKDDQRFCALIDRLGTAAVTVDLLEVKHSSPVQFIRNGQGSTKGASFILYNSARLETLLRTFDERVEKSDYRQLPPINEVDFTLLNEEEEWQLLYGYIFTFPNLLESCLEQIDQGICHTHIIVRYLNGFVAIFSVYYRRIRILTEKRDHLMPYVYARIYLLKALRVVLNKALALLDIQPVNFM